MKSDKLQRKSFIKEPLHRPASDMTLYDYTQDKLVCDAPVLMSDLIDNGQKEMLCIADNEAQACEISVKNLQDILFYYAEIIDESPAARALLKQAALNEWSVGFAHLEGGSFHLDCVRQILLLDNGGMDAEAIIRSSYFRYNILMSFLRGLRDIWHEEHNRPFEIEFAPEDVLMLERVRAADCDVVMMLAIWEMRGAGLSDIWRHLIGSSEGDIALSFSKYIERHPSKIFDGGALAYAFKQWYEDDERVNGCDHQTLEALDDVMQDYSIERSVLDKDLSAFDIEALSILPDQTCYLSSLGEAVLNDPYFAGLKDEINQAHLFQLVYDLKVTLVNNVPFRDGKLARRLFPDEFQIHLQ